MSSLPGLGGAVTPTATGADRSSTYSEEVSGPRLPAASYSRTTSEYVASP